MKIYRALIPFLFFLSLGCSSGGAGDAGGVGDSGDSEAGTGTLSLTATDAPIDHDLVEEALISVDQIRIHASADSESGFHTIYDGPPIELSLLDLCNGVTRALVSAEVPAASYRQIRLHVSRASLRLVNGNEYSTEAGTLKLTSQDKSGFKVFVDPPVVVQSGFSSELLLDFDLTKTFKPVPANDPPNAASFKLHPVIRAANLSECGEVRGVVTTDDGNGGFAAVADATVYILPPGETDLNNSIASTFTGADGAYAVLGLPAGDVDLLATKGGLRDRINAVLVTAGSVTTQPVDTAVKNASIGRTTVITGSSSAQVTLIESTPVSGVEMRNEAVAPLPAPCLRSAVAVGMTEQEQSGTGMPYSDALKTERRFSPPSCFRTALAGTKTRRSPATRKPIRR
jgi:hypothetical protein